MHIKGPEDSAPRSLGRTIAQIRNLARERSVPDSVPETKLAVTLCDEVDKGAGSHLDKGLLVERPKVLFVRMTED